MFGSVNISTISIKGVAAALGKHAKGHSKGIKAHFRISENGMFSMDKVCIVKKSQYLGKLLILIEEAVASSFCSIGFGQRILLPEMNRKSRG
jgi:hypothetical protein